MPAVSFYLPEDILAHLRAESKARNMPVSNIVREAVLRYLQAEEKQNSKKEFIKMLRKADLGTWEEVHAERERSESNRR